MIPSLNTAPSSPTGMLLGDILHRGAQLWGERPAFLWGDEVRTYRQCQERVLALRTVLVSDGVGFGTRIAVLSVNAPEVIELAMAASLLGAVIVPMNPRLSAADLRFQRDDSAAAHALVHPALHDLAEAAGLLDGTVWHLAPHLEERLAAATVEDTTTRPEDSAPLVQLYTSGTTGEPKGCLLTNRGWIAAATNLAHAWAVTPRDRIVAVYPFFHVAGFGMVLTHLFCGGSVVIAGSPDPGELWSLVARHGGTIAGFPGLRTALTHEAAASAGTSLRIVYGGAGMESLTTLAGIAQVAPTAEWIGVYGSTESGNIVTISTLDDERDRPGTIGRPVLGYDLAILSDDGVVLPPGEVGELGLRGPSTMIGYAGRPADTEAVTRGGWLHTGDLMRMDDDGFVYFVDRAKDMIKSGGENVYSIEVETVLFGHTGIADVAVIGVPDDRWGEAVKALVVRCDPDLTADGVDEWCAARLAGFKRPRWYEFTEAIPRSQTGKLVKRDLRAAHDPAVAQRLPERS